MFDLLRNKQQDRLLRKLTLQERSSRIENIEHLKKVGIVFQVGNEEVWDALYHYIKALMHDNREVWLAGFLPKETAINYIVTHPLSSICNEKEDVNFFGIPKDNVMDNFLNHHYDLLIDTTAGNDFFGKYISAKASADLKVTYVDSSAINSPYTEQIFDLMIRGDKPMDLLDYLTELTRYLTMIKK